MTLQQKTKSFSALSNEVVPSALTRVPRGHLWLEGDNAAASVDSRHFGPAPAGLVEGKARLAVFPYASAKAWTATYVEKRRALE